MLLYVCWKATAFKIEKPSMGGARLNSAWRPSKGAAVGSSRAETVCTRLRDVRRKRANALDLDNFFRGFCR